MNRFWHPFANMGLVRNEELVLVRGEGCEVIDRDGNRYLDAAAGLWFCNVGHGRKEIAAAYAKQAATLAACSGFEQYTSDRTLELAERVAELAPFDNAVVFFTSGGSDGVETAAKISRAYWAEIGKPEKLTIISREGSYHGAHAFGTSIAGLSPNRELFGTLVREHALVPRLDADALADEIDHIGPGHVAAFFAEPVMNPGVYPPEGDYLRKAQQVCRERDVLFVADEVVTGFGRVGNMFASARYGIVPDAIICAKGLTSGYAPLGAVIFSWRVAEPFWRAGAPHMLRHGYTYSGHAASCAAAMANLDIMEAEELPQRVAENEAFLAEALASLKQLPEVSAVRSAGYMGGVQLDPELVAEDPEFPTRAIEACRSLGVLTRMLSGFAYQVSPPLTIEREQIQVMVEVIGKSVEQARRTTPLAGVS